VTIVDGVYASTTSVSPGENVAFRLLGGEGPTGEVTVTDVATGEVVLATRTVTGPQWSLNVPLDWPSSLYVATFDTPDPARGEAYFVVRASRPGGVLVTVPFLTWQAYNRPGVPGEGLYLTEQPDRARRVSFDRPGGGSREAGDWELPFYRWLTAHGYAAAYCSSIDLHTGAVDLDNYRLLISPGHDEYWTWEMRDAVEAFVDAGGNFAVFSGNTCWWQARLEDDLRTLVCHRDATEDPMTAADPSRATVEWSSAPVGRPENTLLGTSWRRGAGCWENFALMNDAAFTTRFADHWVFEGTGLRDGDHFAQGAVGYETDAVDFAEADGVPWATGRDGAPPSTVVLATADLRHWRQAGQGGQATMVVLRRGRGQVFNAATVNWCNRLTDPVVDRITHNVVRRLSERRPPGSWEEIGGCAGLTALAAAEGLLFGATADGNLVVRDIAPQNLQWRPVQGGDHIVALAAPRESDAGRPYGLYGLGRDGQVRFRDPVAEPAPWSELGPAPRGTIDIALVFESLFAITSTGDLWRLPLRKPVEPGAWQRIDRVPAATCVTGLNGRLYLADENDRLHLRSPAAEHRSRQLPGSAGGSRFLTGHAGLLIGGGPDGRLRWASTQHTKHDTGRDECAGTNS
jgi:hypothetical protein